MEEAVRKVAVNTIGCTRKQARNEWFDEEFKKANEEKNDIERKPSRGILEQRTTSIDKPNRKKGTCLEKS